MGAAVMASADAPLPPVVFGLPLCEYQRDTAEAIRRAEQRGIRRQLIALPTGAGKTVNFSHLIGRRRGRALVLAHREELLAQAADKIRTVDPAAAIGLVKAEANETAAPIVVASIQTLAH